MRVKNLIQFSLIASMLIVLTSERVEAQAWLEDRKRTEGHGIRLGDFELHPGLGTEVGYDNNVFLEDEDAQDSVLLRISPHLFLSTLGKERRGDDAATPPAVTFRVGGASSFYHYFYSSELDDFSVGADLDLTINPDRPVSFEVNESFTRNIRPFTEMASDGRSYDYARNQNNLGGLLMFATKSGLFKAGLGFDWGADWFEEELFNDKDSFTYSPNAKTSWQFLPMTALLYDVRVDFQNYLNAQNPLGSNVDDNARIASRIGVNGVLTSTISMTMLLGYAAGFYDVFEEYDDIIGQIEARWRASPSFTLKLGYDRSYESALEGNFTRRDRGYANALLLMGGAFLLDMDVWAGLLQYGVPRWGDGTGDPLDSNDPDLARQDVRVSAKLSGEYRFIDWLAVTAAVGYLADITDYEYTPGDRVPGLAVDPMNFNKFEAWLGVRAFY